MIQFLAGAKGTGKTKQLIGMANASVKTTDGHIVFIDGDKKHIYDLHYDIRFVNAAGYPLIDNGAFIGFICGVLSQNSDIKEIYIDGLNKKIKSLDADSLEHFVGQLKQLSVDNYVQFIISINWETDELPDAVKALAI